MKELTQKQRNVLDFITGYIKDHAFPPTMREIGEYFSISVKGAYDHVEALRKKGFLRLGDKRSRTLEIIKDDPDTNPGVKFKQILEVPLLGTVAAGRPILSEENWEGTIPIHHSLLKRNADHFALTVRGDSMIGAGIMDGDIAVIEKRESAENQEIVVALVDEAVTLKRFFKESNRIRLEPENPKYKPIFTQNARILGRLAHIIRSY
ncbi:LexA repressor [Treponema primitia ZAS-2]|uniref:LexA repressor n=1 Tax=Treponema primitia (strain ATCC BAA-887 / DSM 12427 / ZAS-2) TaxID=545694 RepID=F5YK05_TREPZ|nr:transcriptional repressor LexA [Treponema primitia]AEF85709.1 LexA repressor [Treponema primitia ZAS-2]